MKIHAFMEKKNSRLRIMTGVGIALWLGILARKGIDSYTHLLAKSIPITQAIVSTTNPTTQEIKKPEYEHPYEIPERKIDYAVDDNLVRHIIQIESAGNPKATSNVGARGLMQIMPLTWKEETRKLYGKSLDFSEAYNPEKNKEVGIFYLGTIEKYLSGRINNWDSLSKEDKQSLIAAAYNGGMGRLVRLNGNIEQMPEESRNYVNKLERINLSK